MDITYHIMEHIEEMTDVTLIYCTVNQDYTPSQWQKCPCHPNIITSIIFIVEQKVKQF